MVRPTRELSIDELNTVSGGDGDFGLGSAIHLESVRLETVRDTPVSPTPPIGESKASAWAKAGKAKISIR